MSEHEKPMDRRVVRTRELLLDTLRDLLMERGYERLTIQNLIDRAGVGRATFYAHFESKDDLLACSISRLRDGLRSAARHAPGTRFAFLPWFFDHLNGHRQIYAMTVCREDEITVERHIRLMLVELVQRDIAGDTKPTDVQAMAAQYVVGALWSTIVWWMDTAPTLPSREVCRRFQQLTYPGLDALLASATASAAPVTMKIGRNASFT
jgi:AcrR family transcriptional regulator